MHDKNSIKRRILEDSLLSWIVYKMVRLTRVQCGDVDLCDYPGTELQIELCNIHQQSPCYWMARYSILISGVIISLWMNE